MQIFIIKILSQILAFFFSKIHKFSENKINVKNLKKKKKQIIQSKRSKKKLNYKKYFCRFWDFFLKKLFKNKIILHRIRKNQQQLGQIMQKSKRPKKQLNFIKYFCKFLNKNLFKILRFLF